MADPQPGRPGPASQVAQSAPHRRPSRTLLSLVALAVVLLAAVAVLVSHRRPSPAALSEIRPSGIPANVSTAVANLMGLSPVHGRAPDFRFVDQLGRSQTLTDFRGQTVVLEFMDPHCIDICPIVSQEFIDAYKALGASTSKVVFLAINVNRFHRSVADVAGYSRDHRLDSIPSWHFLTGPTPALVAAWRSYAIQVVAPNPNADILHTSAIYFIDPAGNERFVASPMVDKNSNGTPYLPARQITTWASGIASTSRDLLAS